MTRMFSEYLKVASIAIALSLDGCAILRIAAHELMRKIKLYTQ